jgi:hypothetical protein
VSQLLAAYILCTRYWRVKFFSFLTTNKDVAGPISLFSRNKKRKPEKRRSWARKKKKRNSEAKLSDLYLSDVTSRVYRRQQQKSLSPFSLSAVKHTRIYLSIITNRLCLVVVLVPPLRPTQSLSSWILYSPLVSFFKSPTSFQNSRPTQKLILDSSSCRHIKSRKVSVAKLLPSSLVGPVVGGGGGL